MYTHTNSYERTENVPILFVATSIFLFFAPSLRRWGRPRRRCRQCCHCSSFPIQRWWHRHQVKPISLGKMPWYCVSLCQTKRNRCNQIHSEIDDDEKAQQSGRNERRLKDDVAYNGIFCWNAIIKCKSNPTD